MLQQKPIDIWKHFHVSSNMKSPYQNEEILLSVTKDLLEQVELVEVIAQGGPAEVPVVHW